MIERWLRHNWSRFSQGLLTLLLAGVSIFALAQSFHSAHWVRDDAPVVTGFGLGLLIGWGLAVTRWRGWFAAVYSLLLAFVTACQMLGGIVQLRQMLEAPGFWQAIALLNLRGLAFYYRASGWFQAAFLGRRVEDTAFFVFLMTLLAFCVSVWLIWWVRRRHAAFPGMLVAGLLLAVNTHLSKQGAGFLLLFLFSAVLLLARTALLDRYSDWDNRTVDYPYDLGLNWGAISFGIALCIGLIAWLAGLAGTPQSWRNVADWFRAAREETSETVERLFPNIRPPAEDLNLIRAETPNLTEIGFPIPQGTSQIMSVSLNDPYPQPDGVPGAAAPPVHYWRNQIFGMYTGRGWEPVPVGDEDAAIQEETPPIGRYALQQRYQITAVHTDALYAASQPAAASEGVRLVLAGVDESVLARGDVDTYQVTSWVPLVAAKELRQAGTTYPEGIRDGYLQLPDSLPKRVRDLAERIAAGAISPYDQALQVQAYLRQNYTYDLSVGVAPDGADVVDDFLFRTQAGFCSHFATAMAVMLRSQGIPARVAAGYAMGTFDYEEGFYRVTESESHAWVEVYFPGYGWIEFEPTASVGTITYPEEAVPLVVSTLTPSDLETTGLAGRWWFWLGLGAGLAGLVAIFMMRTVGFVRSSGREVNAPAGFYRRMRISLTRLGMHARLSTTPQEFMRQNADQLRGYPQIQAALTAATQLHEQAVYSQRPPTRAAFLAAQRAWQEAIRERLKLAQRRVIGVLRRNRD